MEEGFNRRRRFWLELIVSLVIIFLAIWIFYHRQFLLDQITLWRYPPSAQAETLAKTDKLTSTGERYFYVSQPQLLGRKNFVDRCPSGSEKTIILGCYNGSTIFIYKVNDSRLPYVEEVTAAHEMLHAAYARLSSGERKKVDQMVKTALKNIKDQRILNLVDIYEKAEPGELQNEMHSILGTEVKNLPADLESYYARYFKDRQEIVDFSKQYEDVFDKLKDQQQDLVANITDLVHDINSRNAIFTKAVKTFQADVAAFNQRASSGGFTSQAEYDQQRATLLNRQSELNHERDAINDMIDELKDKQTQLNKLIIEAASLNYSLDASAPATVPKL